VQPIRRGALGFDLSEQQVVLADNDQKVVQRVAEVGEPFERVGERDGQLDPAERRPSRRIMDIDAEPIRCDCAPSYGLTEFVDGARSQDDADAAVHVGRAVDSVDSFTDGNAIGVRRPTGERQSLGLDQPVSLASGRDRHMRVGGHSNIMAGVPARRESRSKTICSLACRPTLSAVTTPPKQAADGSRSPTTRPLPGWLAILLVAGTSAAVLVLEILASRLLAPYVGVSLDTYTGIIGTILAGIAVGAWAGGYFADRVDPRRLLPVLVMLGGALAITTIPIVRVIGSGSSGGGGPLILILAAFGFLPSAMVLSAVPPAVIKLQLRNLDQTGATVGQLSAWSTAGAIFGTFFTGFVLVATAAVSTLIVTTGVLLLASGVAMAFFAGSDTASPQRQATELMGITGLAVMAIFGTVAIESPCETQTSYYCLSVLVEPDDPTRTVLVLDDLRHSYIDVDDPSVLAFWYVRRLVDAIELAPAADDILYLGGGALTIPRYLRESAPGTNQIVFEIDGDLINVVEKQMGLNRNEPEPIEIVVGDARLKLDQVADDSADVVIGDAFGSRSVPFHLATEEFIRNVKRVLRPGGMYAANIIDGGEQRFLAAEAATIARVFDHVVVIRGEAIAAGRRGNSVIVASDTSIDTAALDALRVAAGDPGEVVDDFAAFINGATILTDDFAPVDQLINAGS
jgi:predicted membrane-bound spermidine synthase